MPKRTLTVFEYQTLVVDGLHFKAHHFNALANFNDRHGQRYFKLGYKKVTFRSYVGVIQIGDLVIEILPKADNLDDAQAITKWQKALLTIMRTAGYLKLQSTESASQQLKSRSLLDIYLYYFLQQVQALVQRGLIKRYRLERGQTTVLNGKLLVQQQMTMNLVHQERFFTEHQVYDRNHQLNQILKKAVRIIFQNSHNLELKTQAGSLLLDFEGISDIYSGAIQFDRVTYNRKTEPYQEAVGLAKLIIEQDAPQLAAGGQPVLAILLNMHALFEQFIYRLLKKEEANFAEQQLKVKAKPKIPFWMAKQIIADLILEFQAVDEQLLPITKKVIVDTKWKRLMSEDPDDDDLKQMFTYNFQYGSQHAILLYPYTTLDGSGKRPFEKSIYFQTFEHGCEVHFAKLFDAEGCLDPQWAVNFLTRVLSV